MVKKNKYSKMSNEELLSEYGRHYSWNLQGISNDVEGLKNEILSRFK